MCLSKCKCFKTTSVTDAPEWSNKEKCLARNVKANNEIFKYIKSRKTTRKAVGSLHNEGVKRKVKAGTETAEKMNEFVVFIANDVGQIAGLTLSGKSLKNWGAMLLFFQL